MEEIAGIPGKVPPLALYPDADVKASLLDGEWEACLESWLFSLEFRLRLQETDFCNFKFSQSASGVDFLLSYFESNAGKDTASSKSQKERVLFKRAYLLLRRLLLVTEVPFDCGNDRLIHFLEMASGTYATVADWKAVLKLVWKRDQKQLTQAVADWKRSISRGLSESLNSQALVHKIHRINDLVKVSPDTGLDLMTGSDYLETLMEAFNQLQRGHETSTLEKVLTEHLFYCLRGLMVDSSSHGSLLLDHLYFMKSEAERTAKTKNHHPTLCSSLICSTSFLKHLATNPAIASGKRGQGLLDFLTTYRENNKHLHPPTEPRRRKVSKGKGKAEPNEDMHIHKASQISQVHDLFPELSNHYILKLLDHFGDDAETVVAALLEPDSLPADLRDQGSHAEAVAANAGPTFDLAPRSTPPLLPQRKNMFDDDDFDRLQVSSQRLHRGRKEINLSQAETEDEHAQRKAAIISALAAFDSDDDERDDTYDVADVGGTVDATLDTDDRPRPERLPDQNPHEETLFRAWRDNPELYARDSKTRISKIRQELKRDTGMSDEQIEGWAIMLKKDPKLQDLLDKKYAATQTFKGNQATIVSSRWKSSDTGEDSEDGEVVGRQRRMGQAEPRGNRTWGRGGRGGGSTAGPSGDAATQAARRRKEQGRGRGGASHNRREGRARKMGRGMASVVPQ
ncbi:CUE domain containing protein [Cladophialophora carrionii]|uniref:CUE domain containing protein n=1 Tax=Cladophialophora carrionii TaxID=86049 RepID=A0A1C1CHG6_9EURO|nr:CUE domain containing protein [Cladophialophora carrionii]